MLSDTLSLPRPWQRVMTDWPELQPDSAFYAQLAGYLDSPHKPLDRRILSGRNVDLETGVFTGYLRDGRSFTADTQYLGTHDGTTHDGLGFLWADADPSFPSDRCHLARRTRQALAAKLPQLAETDNPKIDRCSAMALLSYAGVESSAELTFFNTGSQAQFICLSDIAEVKKDAVPPGNNPFSISGLLAPQDSHLMRGQTPYRDLAVLEPLLAAASVAYQMGDYSTTLDHIADLKARVTTSLYEQEPGGWIAVCEGLCFLALGNTKDALAALQKATNTDNPPESTLNQIALARCANEGAEGRLIGGWFANANRFVELASSAEQEVVRQALAKALLARDKTYDDPLATLKAAIAERYAQEVTAAQNDAEARNSQTKQDTEVSAARSQRNTAYQSMLMRWFTPGRLHWMNSFTLEPIENPGLINNVRIESQSHEKAVISVSYDGGANSSLAGDYRYILEKRLFPLLPELVWRIAEIWSLSDHGDIRIQ